MVDFKKVMEDAKREKIFADFFEEENRKARLRKIKDEKEENKEVK